MTRRVRVHVSATGNLYMREIAVLLVAGFRDLGAEAVLVTDSLPGADGGWCNLVVAPHEFFLLFEGADEEQCLEAAARSVLVTTEQPGTQWFEVTRRYARVAQAVLDINDLGVEELRASGIPAHRLHLGYHPSWDRWGGDTDAPRPVDVCFMGSLTAQREERLASLAPVLAGLDVRLLVHDGTRPVTETAANFVWGPAKQELFAGTGILLNLHRSATPYFEWHRMLAALANGCVVLTEPAEAYEPLAPFEHFWVAEPEVLADALTMLAACAPLRARLATAAYEHVRSSCTMTGFLRPHLDLLARWSGASSPRSARDLHLARRRATREVLLGGESAATRDTARTRPEIPEPEPAQRVLKRALLNQSRLQRRLDALLCRLEHGADQHSTVLETPSFAGAKPTVSVVVPLYNYEDYVAEALDSALDSVGVDPEVVVVDDHSGDDSRAVVRELMATRPEAPIRLVGLDANLGLSHVRNLALAHVRSPYVFFLDADNAVYPHTLRKLSAALDRDPDAAFSYGMIACFGAVERLLSVFPWDVDRLVDGNYIDAMTLMRRSVLDEVGGFSAEMQNAHGGWEDYELWLRFAAAGRRGVIVPEILARYRVQPTSMVSVVNLDVASVFAFLRDRYPSLPWGVHEPVLATSPRVRSPRRAASRA